MTDPMHKIIEQFPEKIDVIRQYGKTRNLKTSARNMGSSTISSTH